MSALQGSPGELRAVIEIKRAATGKVETYEMVGKITPEQAEELGLVTNKESRDGCNTLDIGA